MRLAFWSRTNKYNQNRKHRNSGGLLLFSLPCCKLLGEALKPSGHSDQVCAHTCAFTSAGSSWLCPFPFTHPFTQFSCQPRPGLSCLYEWSHWFQTGRGQAAEWMPCRRPAQACGCRQRGLASCFLPLPPARGGRLSTCSTAVTGAPRCSLRWTLFFLAHRSLRHFKTESKSKHSWLTSSPLLPLSFLETVCE